MLISLLHVAISTSFTKNNYCPRQKNESAARMHLFTSLLLALTPDLLEDRCALLWFVAQSETHKENADLSRHVVTKGSVLNHLFT